MQGELCPVLDLFPDKILYLDAESRICWMNRWARESGDTAQTEGMLWEEAFQNRRLPDGSEELERAGSKQRYACTRLPWEGGSLCLLESLTDVNSDRIRLKCYEEIISRLDVFGSDETGKIVIAGEPAAQYYGCSVDDVVGRPLSDFYKYHHEEEREHLRVIRTGEEIINKYTDNPDAARNYTYRPLMYSTYPFSYKGHRLLAYTIVQDDRKAQEILTEITQLRRKLHLRDLEAEKCKQKNDTSYSFTDIVGDSPVMLEAIQEAQTIAAVDRNLLIVGETGTGKEVFAQSIHNFSRRQEGPFVAVNCAAIPENLLESTLFGTVKGAYTGAVDTKGLFETAQEGTLFLDELNSMPVSMQTKLLRVLQERKAIRVGGSKLYQVNCRIISAMNEDPQVLMAQGRLRSDLFYRIAHLSLYIPPLRERGEDILVTARNFIKRYNKTFYKGVRDLSPEAIAAFMRYPWPGNVRELDYVVENMVLKSTGELLTIRDLPKHLQVLFEPETDDERAPRSIQTGEELRREEHPAPGPIVPALADFERRMVLAALERSGGNRSQAAALLGISRQNLRYRMGKLGMETAD